MNFPGIFQLIIILINRTYINLMKSPVLMLVGGLNHVAMDDFNREML